MDCIVHGVEKSPTQLSNFHFHSQGCQKLDKVAERWTLNTTSPTWDVSSLDGKYRRERFVAISSVQFISVTQSCPTFCDPMDCSMPGLPVYHQLPQLAQIHVHWVCKEIKPVNPKGNQSWIFIGRTEAEAQAPVLWPPGAKSWLIWKDPDAGKNWRQEEKGLTEDEMVRWHHHLGANLSPLNWLLTFMKSSCPYMCGSISGLSVLLFHPSIFTLCYTVLNYCSLIVNLEIT